MALAADAFVVLLRMLGAEGAQVAGVVFESPFAAGELPAFSFDEVGEQADKEVRLGILGDDGFVYAGEVAEARDRSVDRVQGLLLYGELDEFEGHGRGEWGSFDRHFCAADLGVGEFEFFADLVQLADAEVGDGAHGGFDAGDIGDVEVETHLFRLVVFDCGQWGHGLPPDRVGDLDDALREWCEATERVAR